MNLFFYYAFHSLFNQIKKLCRTWVLIFILACGLIGGIIGFSAAYLEDTYVANNPEEEITENEEEDITWEDEEEEILSGESFFEAFDFQSGGEFAEFAFAIIVLGLIAYECASAKNNAHKIFLPADVAVLFTSPLQPQSVLMFRLMLKIGLSVFACIYYLFMLSDVTEALELPASAGWTILIAFCLTVVTGKLVQMVTYLISQRNAFVKKHLKKILIAIGAMIAVIFWIYKTMTGMEPLRALVSFFTEPVTRWIPIFGWLKAITAYGAAGNVPMALLFIALSVLALGALLLCIYKIPADFYEEAMKSSEEMAELQEAMANDKRTGFVLTNKKERSEKILRDGFNHGEGASVFFFKPLYNRIRFGKLRGLITKTSGTYLFFGVAAALFAKFIVETDSLMIPALVIAAMSFYRAMGNPLGEDIKTVLFAMVPENPWKKLFYSLLGGTVNCALDALPALIVAAVILMDSPLSVILWLLFILSVDYYSTNVSTFIQLVIPENIDQSIRQIIIIMFLYFGLLPDILIIALGAVFNAMPAALLGAAAINIILGILFFGLSPLVFAPKGGKKIVREEDTVVDQASAKKAFIRTGLALTLFFVLTDILQVLLNYFIQKNFPSVTESEWYLWLLTDVPMYLLAFPIAYLVLRKLKPSKLNTEKMPLKQWGKAFLIGVFLMYFGNIVSILFISLVQMLIPSSGYSNPVAEMTSDANLLLQFLFVVIVAPIMEEFVFRKLLIDRLHVYGGKTAVIVSALCFGLFHGNFSQMLYAALLGLVMGYMYLKTGRLRYTIALHMTINFMGGIVVPWMITKIDFNALAAAYDLKEVMASGIWMYIVYLALLLILFAAGLLTLCMESGNISFQREALELPTAKAGKISLANAGMIAFMAAALSLAIWQLFQ